MSGPSSSRTRHWRRCAAADRGRRDRLDEEEPVSSPLHRGDDLSVLLIVWSVPPFAKFLVHRRECGTARAAPIDGQPQHSGNGACGHSS